MKPAAPQVRPDTQPTPYRVLVVDDVALSRGVLAAAVERMGYDSFDACNGSIALDLAREQKPDLILLDFCLPDRDGIEVCLELRSRPETAETPVIFVTGNANPEDIDRAFLAGASDYITKPFRLAEVEARVAVHLGLSRARRELEESHLRLVHAQKLESIGELAAGIAHEINTPAQFVGDNTRFLQESFSGLVALLERFRDLSEAPRLPASPHQLLNDMRSAMNDADVEYLLEHIPGALSSSLAGLERISRIVRSMKEFSHPGGSEMAPADINRAVESTVTVATNEWKYVAEMRLDLDSELPLVSCQLADLNQVLLNLIVNAAHAIADVVGDGSREKGLITVATRRVGSYAELLVTDTGCGIPEDLQSRVFDPFFTTKDVGKGTGQGLALARAVVLEGHKGTITFDSAVGRGTTFAIRLPLATSGEQNTAAEPR